MSHRRTLNIAEGHKDETVSFYQMEREKHSCSCIHLCTCILHKGSGYPQNQLLLCLQLSKEIKEALLSLVLSILRRLCLTLGNLPLTETVFSLLLLCSPASSYITIIAMNNNHILLRLKGDTTPSQIIFLLQFSSLCCSLQGYIFPFLQLCTINEKCVPTPSMCSVCQTG